MPIKPRYTQENNVRSSGLNKDIPTLSLPVKVHDVHDQSRTGHAQWSPYQDNGGTAAAIAGPGFVVVGADTRLNGDWCINTRTDESKLFPLSSTAVLASTGMQADRLFLQQSLKFRMQWYAFNNSGRIPSTTAVAQLLSTTLYHRRFFPLYTFNVLAGLDEDGDGVVFSYDAVGCTEPLQYGATGSGHSFIEPLLDCLLSSRPQVTLSAKKQYADIKKDEALEMLKNAFTAAAERDIFTGDAIRFAILSRDAGIQEEVLPLRRD